MTQAHSREAFSEADGLGVVPHCHDTGDTFSWVKSYRVVAQAPGRCNVD